MWALRPKAWGSQGAHCHECQDDFKQLQRRPNFAIARPPTLFSVCVAGQHSFPSSDSVPAKLPNLSNLSEGRIGIGSPDRRLIRGAGYVTVIH
jgi:hypothetical protein